MNLKSRIAADMKDAMRAKDRGRLEFIRLLRAAIQRKEVDERVELDDNGIMQVIEKQIKQCRDAAVQFIAGGRQDLADKENLNVAFLQGYMPEPLGAAEIEAMIIEALSETGAAGMKDMGKVMGWLKPRLQGRADMAAVSTRVREKLS